MKRTLPWIFAALMLSGGAQAQIDQSQLVRPPDAADLNTYLARLSANPRDVAAMIGAGEAALALDDPRAAAGFFARAEAVSSDNGRVKAGLGRVMLKLQNPGEALRLFDQAVRLGYPDATILADRGLARDMTGDQAGAQRDYQAALQRTPDDAELIRRYAASLGISGQVDAADKVMQPLFYKSDRAAWRYRAFILAMNNRQADAQKIAVQTMPAQLADAILPYMRKMPYLTAAQKAAAVHFGHFPAQVGTSIAAITPTPPAPGYAVPAVEKAPTVVATVAASPAQDRRARRAEQQRQRREATRLARAETRRSAAVQPAPTPMPTPAPTPTPTPTPAVQQPAPQPVQPPPAQAQMVQSTPAALAPAPTRAPATAPVQAAPSQQMAVAASPVQGPPAPGFESVDAPSTAAPAAGQATTATQLNAITLAQAAVPPPASSTVPSSPVVQPSSTPTPTPTPAVAPPPPDPQATRTLADIIRAIDVPEAERQSTVAAVDLVEIEKIQAARRADRLAAANKVKKAAAAKAEADARAKKEAEEKKRLADNPARNWLQIATGANKSALGFTLKAMRRKYDALAPQSAWVASWGRTNRLVVGPFASFTRARTLETKLKGEGADVFAWQSDAGEVVERLGGE